MKLRFLIALLLFLPLSAMATIEGFCDPTPSIIGGFNFKNYQTCKSLLNQCPKHGPVIDEKCDHQVTSQNPVCIQLKRVSMKLYSSPADITVQRMGKNLILATHTYVADGQQEYAILTPNACTVHTVVDPRKLNPEIAKQYQGVEFVMSTWGAPRYQLNQDGSQIVSILLKVTKSCRACEVVGWAKENFYFTADGRLTDVQLESFQKKEPK